jgi:hypothetical protein
MSEPDTSHPALVVVGRAISAGALAVVVVVSAYLAFRAFMLLPACPLAPVAAPSGPPPSCMITPFEPPSAARSQGLLQSPVIGTLTTEPHPSLLVVVLGAAGVRSAIRNHWPGLNRRETTN